MSEDRVVNPPQKPVARSRRVAGLMSSPMVAISVMMPMIRQPATLDANVPRGVVIEDVPARSKVMP